MKTSKFDSWVKKILATEAEEISCSDCFELLPECVEATDVHGQIQDKYSKVKQHLDQCRACHDEYEILLHFARLDAESGALPSET